MFQRLATSASTLVAVAAIGLISSFQVRIASQTTIQAHDPGPRGGAAGAGDPIKGLTTQETEYFNAGKADFEETENPAEGLGPRMNLDSCAGCHLQPAVGGTSPSINPQVAFANASSGHDLLPPFLSLNGPVREVRFVSNADGTADGGVHALFTLTGRPGADGCSLAQPDFAAQLSRRNIVFRIPNGTTAVGQAFRPANGPRYSSW